MKIHHRPPHRVPPRPLPRHHRARVRPQAQVGDDRSESLPCVNGKGAGLSFELSVIGLFRDRSVFFDDGIGVTEPQETHAKGRLGHSDDESRPAWPAPVHVFRQQPDGLNRLTIRRLAGRSTEVRSAAGRDTTLRNLQEKKVVSQYVCAGRYSAAAATRGGPDPSSEQPRLGQPSGFSPCPRSPRTLTRHAELLRHHENEGGPSVVSPFGARIRRIGTEFRNPQKVRVFSIDRRRARA
jgi:hypothetical protein